MKLADRQADQRQERELLDEPHATLRGLQAYAERVVAETDGMWTPAARATQRGRALEYIAEECRRVLG